VLYSNAVQYQNKEVFDSHRLFLTLELYHWLSIVI